MLVWFAVVFLFIKFNIWTDAIKKFYITFSKILYFIFKEEICLNILQIRLTAILLEEDDIVKQKRFIGSSN